MGCCGSKPRVLKGIDHNTPQPLPVVFSESDHPQPHQPQARRQLPLHEILDIDLDHQSDKRPSLSYLFHQNQNEDAKAKTRSEKNEGGENVKEGEASDGEVKGTNEKDEGIMKQESQVMKGAEHKVSEEAQNSNKAEKCEANDSELQGEAKTSAKSSEQSEEELKPQIGH